MNIKIEVGVQQIVILKVIFDLPNANSNFCVNVASREGVGIGKGLVGTKDLMLSSSGLDFSTSEDAEIVLCDDGGCCMGDNMAISPLTRSPLS